MLDFGIRKENFHIAVSIEETTGDNAVTVTVTNEGVDTVLTGTIVFDS